MNDELDRKLKSWDAKAEAPASFNAGVWQKIAARSAVREQSFAGGLIEMFRLLTLTWRGVTAVVLLGVALGTAAGGVEARGVNAHRWNVLGERYADSINPVAITSREAGQ